VVVYDVAVAVAGVTDADAYKQIHHAYEVGEEVAVDADRNAAVAVAFDEGSG